MKVLVIIFEDLVPLSGGGTPRISNIIKAFVKRDHRVYVASSIGVEKGSALRELGCVDLLPLKGVSRLDRRKMLKYLYVHPLNILRVMNYARKIKPDLVVSHNSIAGFAPLLAKGFIKNCLAVLDLTDLLFEYLENYSVWNSMKLVQILGKKLEAKVIVRSDRIITISNSMKDILLAYGVRPEKMEVVCDGVDTHTFELTDGTALIDKYGGGAENIIIFQGVIDPQDHPEIIVDAARTVVKSHPKTVFWIIGDGTALPGLKKMTFEYGLTDNFYFSGWVNQEKVSQYISASDIGLVILPDILSARGRVTLKEFEYWSCGVPPIVPRLPGLEEVIEEGKTGLYYEPDNYKDLADKIILLIKDEKMRRRVGRKGREIVKERFEWEKLADRFVKICEKFQSGRNL